MRAPRVKARVAGPRAIDLAPQQCRLLHHKVVVDGALRLGRAGSRGVIGCMLGLRKVWKRKKQGWERLRKAFIIWMRFIRVLVRAFRPAALLFVRTP